MVVQKNYDITHILADMYISDSGTFFVVLTIQCACYSAVGSLLRFGDVASSYCSPWLAHFERKYLNDSSPWRRKEDYMFNYGFFYAYYLTLFTIAILFSTTVPLITVAGAIFFGIVHMVDGYRILTVHLKEMESGGGLVLFLATLYPIGKQGSQRDDDVCVPLPVRHALLLLHERILF